MVLAWKSTPLVMYLCLSVPDCNKDDEFVVCASLSALVAPFHYIRVATIYISPSPTERIVRVTAELFDDTPSLSCESLIRNLSRDLPENCFFPLKGGATTKVVSYSVRGVMYGRVLLGKLCSRNLRGFQWSVPAYREQ